MKRHWIEWTQTRTRSPMTFWVHRPVDGKQFSQAEEFEPPLPAVVGGKGYPLFWVEVDGFTFQFASLAELNVCIATLGQRHLPTTRRLSQDHGAAGPNGHWLSRLPGWTKSWRYRERAVAYMERTLLDFSEQLGSDARE